jgi:hypothetical protein
VASRVGWTSGGLGVMSIRHCGQRPWTAGSAPGLRAA